MLFRFIYTSRTTRTLTRSKLHELCTSGAARNCQDRLTGMFLYDGVRFLQALEGDHQTVKATMGRIQQDDRHTNISFYFQDYVEEREFPHWSMAEPYGPHEDANLFFEKVRADVANIRDPHLQAQFIGFARLTATSRSRV